MTDYVDTKKLKCLPCNVTFGNLTKLRSHMSVHFNWMKYCCDICSYKSYEKIGIIDHIHKVHNVEDPSKIEAVIFPIPEWETIQMSSKELIDVNNDDVTVIKDDQIMKKSDNEDIQTPKGSKGRGRPPRKKKCLSNANGSESKFMIILLKT